MPPKQPSRRGDNFGWGNGRQPRRPSTFLLLSYFVGFVALVSAVMHFSKQLPIFSFVAGSAITSNAVAVTPDYAFMRMLGNVGGATAQSQVPNVQTGAVIASPSTSSPDYFYSWARDSALTMKVVIDSVENGRWSGASRSTIENWIDAELVHQSSAQPSSSSLGEPKFNVDGSLFTGPWGRPQNDGPALRATAAMQFARNIGLSDPLVSSKLYKSDLGTPSLIKSDLEYVAHHWQDSSFDLWEEIQATHFFTLAVQRRALAEGAAFATDLDDGDAATYYAQQAAAIATKLESFWDADANRVQAYLDLPSGTDRSGLDCAALLGALHGWNQSAGSSFPSPASDRILATHQALTDSFRSLYPLNNNAAAPAAVGTGRYPEDIYTGSGTAPNGGNPWFLCTSAHAEVLYDALHVFDAQGSLSITSVSQPFFAQFGNADVGTHAEGSDAYEALTAGIRTMADGFVNIVQAHAHANGSLAEEFSRESGYNTGASDLTWSYAAFLTASAAADGNPVF